MRRRLFDGRERPPTSRRLPARACQSAGLLFELLAIVGTAVEITEPERLDRLRRPEAFELLAIVVSITVDSIRVRPTASRLPSLSMRADDAERLKSRSSGASILRDAATSWRALPAARSSATDAKPPSIALDASAWSSPRRKSSRARARRRGGDASRREGVAPLFRV